MIFNVDLCDMEKYQFKGLSKEYLGSSPCMPFMCYLIDY